MAQAEGFEPPCRLGKRFSRPPRCDHFDKPAYEILLNTWAFEVARRRRIQFVTFGYCRNKPAYEILLNTWAFEVARRRRIQFVTFGYCRNKPAYEILLNTRAFEVARRRRIRFVTFGYCRNKPAYFLKFVFRILARGEYLRRMAKYFCVLIKFQTLLRICPISNTCYAYCCGSVHNILSRNALVYNIIFSL